MKKIVLLSVILISSTIFLALKKNTDHHHSIESHVADDGAMIVAANAILDDLSEEQTEKALKTFKEEERFRCHLVALQQSLSPFRRNSRPLIEHQLAVAGFLFDYQVFAVSALLCA